MSKQETTEHIPTVMPFEELYELVETYRKASYPGIRAASLRSAWEAGEGISKLGNPPSPEQVAALQHDDARALAKLADTLDLSFETTENLLDVAGDAHTARKQYEWARGQFPDHPDRWSEHYEILASEPAGRQALADGLTALARLTGDTYMLTSAHSRFKVTPETAAEEVMGWYDIPTPAQSLEAEGYVDPRHFLHHYDGLRQAERYLSEEEFGLDHRIQRLAMMFQDFGNVEWYNHQIAEHCRVSVVDGGRCLAPFDRTPENDWRARWAVTIGLSTRPVTVFQDSRTGRLGVERLKEGVRTHEFPEDQERVVAALEGHLTVLLAPGADVRGAPIDVDQVKTVLRAGEQRDLEQE